MSVLTSYNPTDYWIRRGRTYKDSFKYNENYRLQEELLLRYLKNILPIFKSVLEVGCGFGRFTKLILLNHPHIKKYVAVDLSPQQIFNAEKYVRTGINNEINDIEISFIVSDIQSLILNEKYDLVLAAEVLLHILPSEIKKVMTQLVNLSKMHIINIDYYQEQIIPLASHNFLHQYEKIYKEIPSIAEVRRLRIKKSGLFSVDTKQWIFHATKGKITAKSRLHKTY
jgi:SAM-dependent methyltransferase